MNSSLTHAPTSTTLLCGLRDKSNQMVWGQFVARYRPTIVLFGLRAGLDGHESEDAAQHTMIAFAAAYAEGKYDRTRGRLRDWLFGMAANRIKKAFRQRRDREVHIVAASDTTGFFERVPGRSNLEDLWEQEWQAAVIRQCINEVKANFAERTMRAFELFALDGKPAREVATELGINENAVFLAKHKILKRIREVRPRIEEHW